MTNRQMQLKGNKMNTQAQYTEEELKACDAEWEQLQQDQEAEYEESVCAAYASRGQHNIY
jgi:hypothetical protein